MSLAPFPANARAAGLSLFAPAGDDGLCGQLPWPACLANVAAVGAVYATDQGLLEHYVEPSSCAPAVADSACPSGAVVIETAHADQVPAASNSSPALSVLAPAPSAPLDIAAESAPSATERASAYAAEAAAALQHSVLEQRGIALDPNQLLAHLRTTGVPITDPKSALTTPRIDLPRALATLDHITADGLKPSPPGSQRLAPTLDTPKPDRRLNVRYHRGGLKRQRIAEPRGPRSRRCPEQLRVPAR